MSDGGGSGDSGGKGGGGGSSKGGGDSKGGGGSTGFTDTPITAPPTVADSIVAQGGQANIPLVGGTFTAGGDTAPELSSGGTPAPLGATLSDPQGTSADTSATTAATPTPVSNAAKGGASAAGLAPVGGGGDAADLTSLLGGTDKPAPTGGDTSTTATTGGGVGTGGTGKQATQGGGSVMDSLGIKNPLGTALGAAGLGYSMLQGQNATTKQASQLAPGQLEAMQAYLKQAQEQSQSTAPAGSAAAKQSEQMYQQGQNLVQYLQTGTLPPDATAALDQATASAKAAIKSRYASQGLNVDPTQNSVLNQELQQVDQQAIASKADLEMKYQQGGLQLISASQAAAQQAEQVSQNITQTGMTAAGLSSDLYKTLVGIDQTAQKQMGDAISNFAKSVSGSGGGTTINLGAK